MNPLLIGVRRVLVATDFTPLGNQAVPWAYAALAAGGLVKLVHVIAPLDLPSPLVPHYYRTRFTRREHASNVAEARRKLAALVPREAEANGVATETEVIVGRDPARAIGAAAQRFDADLICVGSRRRNALVEMLFGSVASAVIARNTQPVLLVRSAHA